MGKIDLKDAYFSVKIHPAHKKFLKFQWRGITYQYKALPFGLATAPRVFSKIMQGAISHVREKGVRLVQYLDDILVIASSPNQLKEHMKLVAQHLQTLGVLLSEKKCVFQPTRMIEFVGFIVDSFQMKIFLPTQKMKNIVKECRKVIQARNVSAHTLLGR